MTGHQRKPEGSKQFDRRITVIITEYDFCGVVHVMLPECPVESNFEPTYAVVLIPT